MLVRYPIHVGRIGGTASKSALVTMYKHLLGNAAPHFHDGAVALRWLVLALAAAMPIGIHACYKMTSCLELKLVHDAFDPPIDHARYGLLNSAAMPIGIHACYK